jgi:iron complex transport system ATP-binding protein
MLEARTVTIAYSQRAVVTNVSLKLATGKIVAILGPNGAGKSTLLRALNGGLIPISGEVLLDGIKLDEYPRRVISRNIAVVAQEADVRFPVTVLEFVLGGRYACATTGAWGWETNHDLSVAQEVLGETELGTLVSRLMNELSGGERQRAVLARALATEARFLLLDEPTANLDLAHQAGILSLVRRRCDQKKVAAVVVTHDLNLAAEFADYILLMRDGRATGFGTPQEVLKPELLQRVFDLEILVDAHPVTGAPRITPVHQGSEPTS